MNPSMDFLFTKVRKYGTMELCLTMEKLWYFWKKNYGTISKTMEIRVTNKKKLVDN